jgi:hypothetical protein
MPARNIKINYVDSDGIVHQSISGRNDPHAECKVDHTLMADERYLVSPVQSNKAPKLRGRSCIFLKPRAVRGGNIRAKVRFEDDGSERVVDPIDLLPYGEDLPVCRVHDEGVALDANPGGEVSEELQRLRNLAFDVDADQFRDKFRFLVGTWFCVHHIAKGSSGSEFITDLNNRLYQMLGPGHHIQSCMQFMHGKKGQQAFDVLRVLLNSKSG